VEDAWVPQPIDDVKLHERLLAGFKTAKLSLRDQIVIRLAYESGARIREILRLTVGDWRARGCSQEAKAFSKGSRGRRVKAIRFSAETAKMLREYINTDRHQLDRQHRRLEQLSDTDPLFLSARHKPYDYAAFIPNWKKLCRAAKIDLNVHALRHWHVTQAMRVIVEMATSQAEILVRKEELVRYMAWRSSETLKAYEHYFQAQGYVKTHDQLLKRLYEQDICYAKEQEEIASREVQRQPVVSLNQNIDHTTTKRAENGWATLLALGGEPHA
jgi:integrase